MIQLTPEQFKKILVYMYIGNHVLAENKHHRAETFEEETEFEQEIYRIASENGIEGIELYDDVYVPNEDFAGAIHDQIDEYEEYVTRTNLAQKLSARDIESSHDETSLSTMEDTKRFALVEDTLTKYETEFKEHGFSRLFINISSIKE